MADYPFFRIPFALEGDQQVIPEALQATGGVSFQTGYGFDYERDPSSDPNAKDIERDKMNWLFGAITTVLRQYQTYGAFPYIAPKQNKDAPFPYDKSARCLYDDGSGIALYESLIANNTAPPTDAAKWARVNMADFVPRTRKINVTGSLTGGGELSQDVTIGVNVPSSVPPARQINTTAPITGGGALSGDLTLKLNAASAATANYVIQRDANGRAKVAAPAAADDIARKQEVDDAATKAAWDNVTGKPAAYAPSAHNHSAAEITSGVLAVARGGTGQTTVQALRNSMGLGNTTGVLPVANGGTGLSAANSVLTNLASTSGASILAASPRPGVTGTLGVGNGGTGRTTGAAPIPQAASGVGQWTRVVANGSGAATLPSGGTWAYFALHIDVSGNYYNNSAAGVKAGGTVITVTTVSAGNCHLWCWRIA